MAKAIQSIAIPKTDFGDRWSNAREHLEAMALALDAGLYASAAVLAVQSAIAANDAFTIALLGRRCASDRHQDAVALYVSVPNVRGREEGRSHLNRLLDRKYRIEYSGKPVREADAKALAEHARRFKDFVAKSLPL